MGNASVRKENSVIFSPVMALKKESVTFRSRGVSPFSKCLKAMSMVGRANLARTGGGGGKGVGDHGVVGLLLLFLLPLAPSFLSWPNILVVDMWDDDEAEAVCTDVGERKMNASAGQRPGKAEQRTRRKTTGWKGSGRIMIPKVPD